ncbi:PKD domain-containing protein [Methanogenium cariaci]|uniref:PKD domain-containing protein n=1 Tax=Methanogenium cariaci TaxID=2197 RepID=UPI000A7F4399|nr:PKD domain-containing protein [Methanogenium cariaci]
MNSSASPSKAMLPLYPDAVNDSYFIPSPDPLYGLPGVPLEPPVSGFAADVVWGTVPPLTVNFTDQSSGVVDTWYWDVDNDGIIDAFTPDTSYVYTVPGNYSVTLTVSSAGGAHTSGRTISVIEPVTANFTAVPTSGQTPPLQVVFTDQSMGDPDQWLWSFGDGSADSTEQHPYHTYQRAGRYTVSLNASKTGGAGDIMTKVDYILAYAPARSDNDEATGIRRSATATVVLPTGTSPAGEATPTVTTAGAQQPTASATPAPVPSGAGTGSPPTPPATQKSPPLIFAPVSGGLALLLLLGGRKRRGR